MRLTRVAMATVVFFGLTLIGAAGTGDNAKKIVGVWKVVKSDKGPKGGQIEFAKDGKLKVTFKAEDKEVTAEGTYKVKGDKLTVTITFMEKSSTNTATIKKLTEKELIVQGEKGNVTEFERVK
jgi:uncharacterized protein (TIGR03066 family)